MGDYIIRVYIKMDFWWVFWRFILLMVVYGIKCHVKMGFSIKEL
jgi:hypothetical protein